MTPKRHSWIRAGGFVPESVPTAFLVSGLFLSCIYSSIEQFEVPAPSRPARMWGVFIVGI